MLYHRGQSIMFPTEDWFQQGLTQEDTLVSFVSFLGGSSVLIQYIYTLPPDTHLCFIQPVRTNYYKLNHSPIEFTHLITTEVSLHIINSLRGYFCLYCVSFVGLFFCSNYTSTSLREVSFNSLILYCPLTDKEFHGTFEQLDLTHAKLPQKEPPGKGHI